MVLEFNVTYLGAKHLFFVFVLGEGSNSNNYDDFRYKGKHRKKTNKGLKN